MKMIDKSIIAEPRTIKLALEAAENRMINGSFQVDHERVRIIKRVQKTGEADMETILKYRDVNINDQNSRKKSC
jgi:hypothetical protein